MRGDDTFGTPPGPQIEDRVLRENPYQYASFWYWTDEEEHRHGPYYTQVAALRAMLHWIAPPWYVEAWRRVKVTTIAWWNYLVVGV
jgi:hypothetical protein